ncbi:sensor histidine kinase [Latilactobacillus sp. 5-91]|uniref:sensor histidine kinase n=1 Tax=Latilactobacillus sp. 5-91 TaxID=3410924 RepID=UPI003C748B0B
MIFILLVYTIGYLFCLQSLPLNITSRDSIRIGLITIFTQFIVIWITNLMSANIILIYLISIEMFVASLYFFIKKHSIEQLPYVLFVFLLLALGTQLSELIIFKILGISYLTQESNIFWICVNTAIPILFSFSISKFIFKLYQRYRIDSKLLKKYDNLKLSILILSMIALFFTGIIMTDNPSVSKYDSLITSNSFLMIIVTITCSVFVTSWLYRKNTLEKLNYERIINSQLKEYLNSLEELENTQRQFRHDFINIYGSFSGYIENDDMPGLKKYYYKEIEHINSEQNKKSFQLKSLSNMKIIELKGLLSLKITKAESLGVSINIEIVNPVNKLNVDLFDFNRCIGILLDNAIEASANIEETIKIVDIIIFNESSDLTILIKNNLIQNVNIDTIFKKGYSTKGNNRGLGLSEVEHIINSTKNMSLETTIENSLFIQKIIILKED